MSIKRILIPTDFSETAELAIQHGIYMTRLFNAKLFLLHSIESFTSTVDPDEPILLMEPEITLRTEEQKLELMANKISKQYNIEVSGITTAGRPTKRIADTVRENEIDIIIMGTHGVDGLEELLVGSNTHRVVNLVPCPVISIQKFIKKVEFSNILVPINNDFYSRQKINNVIELAAGYKSTIHILGLPETDNPVDNKKFQIKIDSVENALKHAHIPFVKKMSNGNNLATEAMKYCEDAKCDLIAIMTGHESILNGMFAKQIINHSKIPVLSIKHKETTMEDFMVMGGDN